MKLRAAFLLTAFAATSTIAQNAPSSATSRAADPGTPRPSFIIADIHPSPHTPYPNNNGGQLFGDRYIMHQATMVDLIRTAYTLDGINVQGGPSWMERDRFEVIAKVPPKTPPMQLKLMLQQLLSDRFQLVEHKGMKPMPAWVLTVKDKAKIKESDSPGTQNCKEDGPQREPGSPPLNVISLSCTSYTMDQFTGLIHNIIGGNDSVIDQTNMPGIYDFHFRVTPAQLMARAGTDAIPMADALDKQLGMHLSLETAPREVLLVDSVLRTPVPNSPDLAKILPPPPPPEFDVATIRPSDPEAKGAQAHIDGGQVNIHNFTFKMLIPILWNLNEGDDNVIANSPKWFDTDKFDIVAKVSPEAIASNAGTGEALDIDALIIALKNLLIQRFQMKFHMEDRPIDSYRLTAPNPKLKAADPTARTVCKEGPGPDGKDPRTTNPSLNRLVTCTNMSMEELADELQRQANGYIHNPIQNATNLKGGYDFTLSFSAAGLTNQPPPTNADPSKSGTPSDPNGAITLFDAVQHQLGLKLEKVKRPLPVLVIDSATETPTDN